MTCRRAPCRSLAQRSPASVPEALLSSPDDPFYTPNRKPPPPPPRRPQEPLWSLRKGDRRIDCALLDHGDHGVEAVLSRDGEWYAGRRFDLREQAVGHADDIRADLERQGWKPSY